MRLIVAYDIADDRRRDRLATVPLNYGQRLQESLFLCDIDAILRHKMEQEISATVEQTADQVHLVPVCASCWAGVRTWGMADKPADPPCYLL